MEDQPVYEAVTPTHARAGQHASDTRSGNSFDRVSGHSRFTEGEPGKPPRFSRGMNWPSFLEWGRVGNTSDRPTPRRYRVLA